MNDPSFCAYCGCSLSRVPHVTYFCLVPRRQSAGWCKTNDKDCAAKDACYHRLREDTVRTPSVLEVIRSRGPGRVVP